MKIRLTSAARSLRRQQTDVEAKLWAMLRDRRMGGLKFRRQVPRGRYVVDFMCDDAMLIVELDGSQHTDPTHATRDAERTEYLEALGYLVVRIWNTDINQNLIGVLDGLWATANARRKAPSSGLRPPSPQGEKESNLREGS